MASPRRLAVPLIVALAAWPGAQEGETQAKNRASDPAAAVTRAVEILLAAQEGDGADAMRCEWPYEGVYRERGEIPLGYRVGGTAIAAQALVEAPGYARSKAAHEAVARALRFVLQALDDPALAAGFRGGYDVRGWGHVYALQLLLRLRSQELVPEKEREAVDARIAWLVDALAATEIGDAGGWNYARRAETGSPASPFMTAPALLALFEARAQGFDVDAAVVERALAALERARTEGGWTTYHSGGGFASLEGSIGRNCAVEAARHLAGRGSVADVRRSLEWFVEHWEHLEHRRKQTGTHAPPYGIAPYYFFYAHRYAAVAVELLPEAERPELRARLRELLFRVQEDSGGWNDRVFPRSEAYGTAMSVLALLQPELPRPSAWNARDR